LISFNIYLVSLVLLKNKACWLYNLAHSISFELNKLKKDEKTSKYNGVSYDSKRKYYVAGIQYGKKTFNLGNNSGIFLAIVIYPGMSFNKNLHCSFSLRKST